MRHTTIGLGMWLALAACGGQPIQEAPPGAPPADASAEETPAEEAATGKADEAILRETKGAAKQLGSTLKERLVATLKDEGPAAAMEVCSSQAQDLTAKVVAEKGIQVGRASLRLRNPENAAPAWVQEWLDAQGERKVEGLEPLVRVDDTDGARKARVLVPIGVEEACLLCHGPKETLTPDVSEVLAQRYPEDAATGYAVGDLRGALWAEAAAPLAP